MTCASQPCPVEGLYPVGDSPTYGTDCATSGAACRSAGGSGFMPTVCVICRRADLRPPVGRLDLSVVRRRSRRCGGRLPGHRLSGRQDRSHQRTAAQLVPLPQRTIRPCACRRRPVRRHGRSPTRQARSSTPSASVRSGSSARPSSSAARAEVPWSSPPQLAGTAACPSRSCRYRRC